MPRADAMGFAAVNTLHSCRTLAFESYPGDQCVSQHRQIRSVHVGEGIRTKYGLALSIAKPYVHDRATARTLHHATVLIFKGRDPDRTCSLKHGQRNWTGVRHVDGCGTITSSVTVLETLAFNPRLAALRDAQVNQRVVDAAASNAGKALSDLLKLIESITKDFPHHAQ